MFCWICMATSGNDSIFNNPFLVLQLHGEVHNESSLLYLRNLLPNHESRGYNSSILFGLYGMCVGYLSIDSARTAFLEIGCRELLVLHSLKDVSKVHFFPFIEFNRRTFVDPKSTRLAQELRAAQTTPFFHVALWSEPRSTTLAYYGD